MENIKINQKAKELETLNNLAEKTKFEEEKKKIIDDASRVEEELDRMENELGVDPQEVLQIYEKLREKDVEDEIDKSVPPELAHKIKEGNLDFFKGWIRTLSGMKKVRMAACFLMLSFSQPALSSDSNPTENIDSNSAIAQKIDYENNKQEKIIDLNLFSKIILDSYESDKKWDGEEINIENDERIVDIVLQNQQGEDIDIKAFVVKFSENIKKRFNKEFESFLRERFDLINKNRDEADKVKFLIITEPSGEFSPDLFKVISDEGSYFLLGNGYPKNNKSFVDEDDVKRALIKALESVI